MCLTPAIEARGVERGLRGHRWRGARCWGGRARDCRRGARQRKRVHEVRPAPEELRVSGR